ncbi:response regulator transcription factor [Cohnella cholangitidis]|uniref:Response regulator n=1 Tax=Cohnella cholangitidis TaxID=2598458 RepID=A0A7G5C1S4_9BACL|nr:response regulator [Cohnella cholangitidis]QMV43158.1 response regulator [Cohnella cholangitidis]
MALSKINSWKVLIADDEPIIREGLREAVDWQAIGLEVVAEAEDGEEALELAIKHQVDVMLVDLNMPIKNGLMLIQEAKQLLPSCRIVIVSGHDEFNYAQQAVHFGVDEYILKPANPGHLTEVLSRIAGQLEQTKAQEKHFEQASRQIRKNIPLLRERFCNEWIEEAVNEKEVQEQLRFLDLPDTPPSLFGIVRWPEIDLGQSVRSERDRQLMLFAIENIAEEIISPYAQVLFRDPLGFICVIVWNTTDASLFAAIEQAVTQYLKLQIVAQGEPVEQGFDGVAAAYRKAKSGVYKEASISPLVRRARQYLRDHYADKELSLEGTANAIGVSSVYLSRLFKQELGITFVTLVTQLRISKSVQLLSSTNRSIADIAEAVGYDSQHYFSTAFKKTVGVSPIRYRKGEAFEEE